MISRLLLVFLAVAGVSLAIRISARAENPSRAGVGQAAAARQRYQARVSRHDTAARAWRLAHPDGVTNALSDAELLAEDNYGCPEGTRFWHRDRITELCAPLCASDADCGPEDGRCRILDVADRSKAPQMPLVEELPPEELAAWMEGADPRSPPVMLCDPFWEFEGALDADLVDVTLGQLEPD